MKKFALIGWTCWLLGACAGPKETQPAQSATPAASISAAPELLTVFDSTRNRAIPVALYRPAAGAAAPRLAVLNHGYGGQHTGYSFIARALAARGYLVASIQHELPGDAPLPTTGNIYQARLPSWRQGVQSILWVRRELQRREPRLKADPIVLIGHSHGGDMAVLLATEQPALVDKVVSLDNRRVPLPRARRPQVLSLRSSDQQADPGVLPTAAEQAKWGTRIVNLPDQLHNDMYDGATPAQQEAMLRPILAFVEE